MQQSDRHWQARIERLIALHNSLWALVFLLALVFWAVQIAALLIYILIVWVKEIFQ